MKKPEEIKTGLHNCLSGIDCPDDCPYYSDCIICDDDYIAEREALAYILRLETQLETVTCNFMDFVNNGVHNPAPYCAFASELCVDGRGWCRPGCVTCNGFVPKMEVE